MRGWMKVKFTGALLGCLAAAFLLTGCGGGGNNSTDTDGDKADNSAKGYVFEVGGVKLAADMDVSTALEQLGEASNYREEPSCAGQGIAKVYTYSGYEITTYPEDGTDRIACILLKDDTVATQEGIDMSKTREDVIEAYGDGYTEKNESLIYEKDGMQLCFVIQDGNIVSIEYGSSVWN